MSEIICKINEIIEYLTEPAHKKGKRRQYDEQFEFFWKQFKGRWDADKGRYVKIGKFKAWIEWQRLSLGDKRKAAGTADLVRGKYVQDPFRWLRDKKFDDFD